MKLFVKLEGYGQLYIDRVFVEANYPVLFTCLSEDGSLFICSCCRPCMWLIGRTNSSDVTAMLTDRITVRELFERTSEKYSATYDGQWQVTYGDDGWEKCLPDDFYIRTEGDEFDDDIEYLQLLL